MLLREFLYVDVEKVRGLLAQLDDGIVETSTRTDHGDKTTGAGVKGFAEHARSWGSTTSEHKSQGDAWFPLLESALETQGHLFDLSQRLEDIQSWSSLANEHPAGTIVRVTSDGTLFDARYVASTFASFSTTSMGLKNIGVTGGGDGTSAPPPAAARQQQSRKGQQKRRPSSPVTVGPTQIEDAIPDELVDFGNGDSLEADFLKGIVQISRSVFTPGLHLNLRPAGNRGPSVTVRLQEGRQFLDSDPEILFSRYGLNPQRWTVVGSIGFHGPPDIGPISTAGLSVTNADGNVNRADFAHLVSTVIRELGRIGFVDSPEPSGFSVVPLAVYRSIGSVTEPPA